MSFRTADVADENGEILSVCDTQFHQFGGCAAFSGRVRTVSCFEDVGLVWDVLRTSGVGSVLVVDGGGSLHSTLLGDMMAGSAVDNDWCGLVVNGAVRDVAQLRLLPIGIKALGSNPRRSGRTGAGAVDVPVSFGSAVFAPGDTVFADEDGVVVLPRVQLTKGCD
ncbi:ribonuclease E activity regulator RraA [Kutzneria sp. NPDC052558]|uniref:ribonuclease E activity regulator RraA n=1 Tax=Kutzneria sp. NPDC052558 TaxID=3364121 RepID=UPI0037C9C0AC